MGSSGPASVVKLPVWRRSSVACSSTVGSDHTGSAKRMTTLVGFDEAVAKWAATAALPAAASLPAGAERSPPNPAAE